MSFNVLAGMYAYVRYTHSSSYLINVLSDKHHCASLYTYCLPIITCIHIVYLLLHVYILSTYYYMYTDCLPIITCIHIVYLLVRVYILSTCYYVYTYCLPVITCIHIVTCYYMYTYCLPIITCIHIVYLLLHV